MFETIRQIIIERFEDGHIVYREWNEYKALLPAPIRSAMLFSLLNQGKWENKRYQVHVMEGVMSRFPITVIGAPS